MSLPPEFLAAPSKAGELAQRLFNRDQNYRILVKELQRVIGCGLYNRALLLDAVILADELAATDAIAKEAAQRTYDNRSFESYEDWRQWLDSQKLERTLRDAVRRTDGKIVPDKPVEVTPPR